MSNPPRRLGWYLRRMLLAIIALPILIGGSCRLAAGLREKTPNTAAAPSTGRLIRAGDVDVFVQQLGPDSGPPVLLIHGTGAWGAIWQPTMEVLAAAGYRAITIDLPPFGFSGRPLTPRYDDASQAMRVLGVMEALDLREVVLVGHSFGGRPTVEAIMQDPSRVHSLVLVDAALNPVAPGTPVAEPGVLVKLIASSGWIRDPLVATTLTNPLLTRWLFGKLVYDPKSITDANVQMVEAQFPVQGTTHALGLWLQEFLVGDATPMNRDRTQYARVAVPTLLIWGEEDNITPLATTGETLKGLLQGSEMVTLPATGHIPAIENPDGFHRALLSFLDAHRRAWRLHQAN